jgi:site-specific recombinase XerD
MTTNASFKTEISDALLAKRKLTDSTLRTYTSLLSALNRKMDGKKELEFFTEEATDIKAYIAKIDKPQSRKTILSALFVLTNEVSYSEVMRVDIKLVNDIYSTKKMSSERKEKALSIVQVKAINATIIDTYKKNPTTSNLNDVLISVLMSGEYFPPRRLEWAMVKVKDFNEDTDNYIVKNKVHFNKYKTHSVYGKQVIELPKKVMPWVNKVLKDKNREYLIVNSKGKHFSASLLSKTLTGLYGIGIDMLRSTYINDVVYGNDAFKKMEASAKAMGNSVGSQQSFYVKTS